MAAHILLVEDTDDLRYVLKKILEKAGFAVKGFRGYWDLTEHLATGAEADLLITDIGLSPGTPHGIAVAAMARMQRRTLPVLFLTGHPDYIRHVPDDSAILIKPVPDDILVATVTTLVNHAKQPVLH